MDCDVWSRQTAVAGALAVLEAVGPRVPEEVLQGAQTRGPVALAAAPRGSRRRRAARAATGERSARSARERRSKRPHAALPRHHAGRKLLVITYSSDRLSAHTYVTAQYCRVPTFSGHVLMGIQVYITYMYMYGVQYTRMNSEEWHCQQLRAFICSERTLSVECAMAFSKHPYENTSVVKALWNAL